MPTGLTHRSSMVVHAALAAAFVGPGTVTACARAGHAHGTSLLWALGFSMFACYVLQESAARIRTVTGQSLGAAPTGANGPRPVGRWFRLFLAVAVITGCAAYESGNILGGVAGVRLLTDAPAVAITAAFGFAAAILLWFGSTRLVAVVLSVAVAAMGIVFLITAFRVAPPVAAVARGLVVPSVAGDSALVLALVGTTVVPYNLFLGPALVSPGDPIRPIRVGLAAAIVAGGILSMAIVVTGTTLAGGAFSFDALADELGGRFGTWAAGVFALGLAAAGFTSAITAPMAAALTARAVFADADDPDRWGRRSWRFRAVWLGVLAFGLLFGLTGIRPIPAIILAQAFNGVLLPLVAIALVRAVNDRDRLGEAVNRPAANAAALVVVAVTLVLGARGLWQAATALLGS